MKFFMFIFSCLSLIFLLVACGNSSSDNCKKPANTYNTFHSSSDVVTMTKEELSPSTTLFFCDGETINFTSLLQDGATANVRFGIKNSTLTLVYSTTSTYEISVLEGLSWITSSSPDDNFPAPLGSYGKSETDDHVYFVRLIPANVLSLSKGDKTILKLNEKKNFRYSRVDFSLTNTDGKHILVEMGDQKIVLNKREILFKRIKGIWKRFIDTEDDKDLANNEIAVYTRR